MDDPVGRALCMGAYDPQSSGSAGWVLSGVKAAGPKKAAGSKPKKLPRVDLAKKAAENTGLPSEVDEATWMIPSGGRFAWEPTTLCRAAAQGGF